MPEIPSSWEERETEARRYNDITYETLRKHGFPEDELYMTCSCSVEVFRKKFEAKYPGLLIPEDCRFIVFAKSFLGFIEYAGFNTKDEFEGVCRRMAETFNAPSVDYLALKDGTLLELGFPEEELDRTTIEKVGLSDGRNDGLKNLSYRDEAGEVLKEWPFRHPGEFKQACEVVSRYAAKCREPMKETAEATRQALEHSV